MQNDNATPRSAAAKANPRAASVRVKALPLSRAKSQRMHDLRIGEQPNYVDGDRKHLNRVLMPLRSLPAIHRENEALRGERGCQKKMKSNAAAVMSGIITFGHQAQVMFACLSDEQQDAAYVEVAERAAALLQTQLEGLVVHADESADHAHFMLRGYCDDGEPVSKRATYQAMSQLQDMVAEVLQHYCPDIERGNGKWDRIANGADYAETLSRSVIRLHQDLPHEIAALEATLQILVEEIAALQASAAKTRRHFEKMEARRDKTAKQLKTARTYKKRLAKKETALSELVIQCGQLRVELDAKDKALNSRETEADCRDKAHQADIMAHADMMAVEAEQFAAEHDALDAQWAAHVIEVRAQKAVAEAHAFALTAERERLAVEKAAHHADVVAHENMVAVEAEQFAAEYDALAVEWSRHMTEVRAHQAVAKAREVDLRLELERAAEDKRAFDAEMAVKAQAFERQQADIAVDEYLAELTRVYAEDVLAAALTKAEAADVARRNDEAAAVLAQSRATSAKQMEADAQARATDFKDLENEAKAHLKLVDAACSAAQSETAAAAKRLETAILAEVEAKAEAAKALQLRDQRHAEIDNAGNAQKLIDDARLRDLDATGKENAFVRQLITLEQGALAQDRAAHVEDLRRKRAGTDARKAALLIENERLAQVVELVHQAGLARRADEYAAEAAGSKAADAKREAVAAKENAAHFKDLVKDAETNLDILIFGQNEVMCKTRSNTGPQKRRMTRLSRSKIPPL